MTPKGQTVLSRVDWKADWGDEGMGVKGKLLSFHYQGIYQFKKGRDGFIIWIEGHKKEQKTLLAWCQKNTVRVSGMKQYEKTQYDWNK